jgi:hypothetical protein
MPKPKPKVNWSARTKLPENPYSNDEVEHIVRVVEGNGKHQLSTDGRQRLSNLVRQAARAFVLATHQRQGPTHGQIKAALKELHTATDKLLRVVKGLDDATVLALLRQHGEFRRAVEEAQKQNKSSDKAQVAAIRIVSALSSEAKAAIKEVGKPHPPSDENLLDWIIDWEMDPIYRQGPPVGRFIVQLADIYYETTGEEPWVKHNSVEDFYYGDFLDFVDVCLKPLESEPRDALGKTIQDHIPKWRETRDLKT